MPTWSNREVERLCELMANDCDLDTAALLLARGFAEVQAMWARICRVMGNG